MKKDSGGSRPLPLRLLCQQKRRFRADKTQQGQSALAHMSDHIHPGIGGEVLPGDPHLTGVTQVPGVVHGDAATGTRRAVIRLHDHAIKGIEKRLLYTN